MIVRDATAQDAPTLAAIYGHHVLHGMGTFEEVPPSVAEMASRRLAVTERDLPYLVADDGGVVGFAYATPFRTRAAYRYTAEDSVYVSPDRLGQGVGKRLVGAVIERCEALGLRQLIAVIGDSANAGSIGLHRSLGFEINGVIRDVGFKHGRGVDIVMMQRVLNGGVGDGERAPGLVLSGP